MTTDSITMSMESTRQQFSTLLHEHRKILFKVASTYARHSEDRADLVQEISAQLWRAYPGYDASRLFSTWMYRIALNVAISTTRSRSRHDAHLVAFDDELHDSADPQTLDPAAAQQLRMLHGFMDQLEKLDRALLLLYLEDHSHAQIADILGIGVSNVATKISRLKQRIRNHIAP